MVEDPCEHVFDEARLAKHKVDTKVNSRSASYHFSMNGGEEVVETKPDLTGAPLKKNSER